MHEDVQPAAEPAEVEAEGTEVLPAWQRPWVRSAVLTGMTVGAFAVAALAGDPSTVVGIG
ncbi:hypothetical protein ACFVYA_27680 [Amycolatopsis sp. NPDC058278]|jgi:hypothetical protein|uniref:hypothetical protein n=1 Tax=unclassified Amycolatopsis TaxID=2618356 RepID=UPI00255C2494|nr:hypothetical protein [Amycolatopsis sp. DG1A-15b]WIX91451.1 hypothetical protein QRY02_13865 [Amycolatopsis sp. DG1A-15b]